jgi:hypothetical protein
MIEHLEYQTLSAALAQRLSTRSKSPRVVVIAQQPSKDIHMLTVEVFARFGVFEDFQGLDVRAVEDLIEKESSNTANFEARFELPLPYELLSDVEAKKILRPPGGWGRFYEKYPESAGVFYLSRVGFDAECSQALFHVGNQWEGRAGIGHLVFSQRVNGRLVVVREKNTWLS